MADELLVVSRAACNSKIVYISFTIWYCQFVFSTDRKQPPTFRHSQQRQEITDWSADIFNIRCIFGIIIVALQVLRKTVKTINPRTSNATEHMLCPFCSPLVRSQRHCHDICDRHWISVQHLHFV